MTQGSAATFLKFSVKQVRKSRKKRQCLSPAPLLAHRKFAQICPRPARNPPPGQGMLPSPEGGRTAAHKGKQGVFSCAAVWWQEGVENWSEDEETRTCDDALRRAIVGPSRRSPAGLRCSFVHLPNRQNLLQTLSRYGTISSTN